MRAPALLVLVLAVLAARAAAADDEAVRVFVARLDAGAGTSEAEAELVADAVLVAARKHRERFDVVGVSDLRSALDLEAQQQAAGCDAVSCASEIADALAAPQIITGSLGRVGDTWLLTITRTDRESLTVLAREQIRAHGDAPDALLSSIPGAVDRLLDAGGVSPLLVGGASALGLAAAVAVAGGALHVLAWRSYEDGLAALARRDGDALERHKRDGELEQALAFGGYGAGALVAVGGASLLTWWLVDGAAP